MVTFSEKGMMNSQASPDLSRHKNTFNILDQVYFIVWSNLRVLNISPLDTRNMFTPILYYAFLVSSIDFS